MSPASPRQGCLVSVPTHLHLNVGEERRQGMNNTTFNQERLIRLPVGNVFDHTQAVNERIRTPYSIHRLETMGE